MTIAIEPAKIEFKPFPKIPRLSRRIVVTEKIDGANSSVVVTEDGRILTGKRNGWCTPEADNFGFAKWAQEHREELLQLGPGTHFGEWWGAGIQRRYGLTEKRFSLFNTARWMDQHSPDRYPQPTEKQIWAPACCHVVPVIYEGDFSEKAISDALGALRELGSIAAPGFNKPEGVVVYHVAAGAMFKKTIEKDDAGKEFGA